MNDPVYPETVRELSDIVLAEQGVLGVGAGTKSPLCQAHDATLVSVTRLAGITEYEPSEFTFTALAGTRVADVAAALAERNQYLPFDPLLVESGATLGGTVASGISGPGRLRYGGLRDFLLGVQFVSGEGKTIHAGGKVVKNAAGFDIPKLMVGSLGLLGIMTSLTFKVFPKPASTHTFAVACESHPVAIERMVSAARSRWEVDALDYHVSDRQLLLRIGGPESANLAIAKEIQSRWNADLQLLSHQDAAATWQRIVELRWVNDRATQAEPATDSRVVLAIPMDPATLSRHLDLLDESESIKAHVSAAGSTLWLAFDAAIANRIHERLQAADLSGLALQGTCPAFWFGRPAAHPVVVAAIADAVDPHGRFPRRLGQSFHPPHAV